MFFFRTSFLALTLAVLSAGLGFAAEPQANGLVRLQGRVMPAPDARTNRIFKSDSGAVYTLKKTPASEALFIDTNLLSRVLLVTGRVQEKKLEITGNLRSVKNGKIHELFYYCDVCSISSSIPGLCQCCRDPSVLVEEPVTGK